MGVYLHYYCPKCDFQLKAKEGEGFHYPHLYEITKKKMIRGELGDEAMDFFAKHMCILA